MCSAMAENARSRGMWKIRAIVVLFGAGLIASGLLRYFSLRADNPLPFTVNPTMVYIIVTVIAAVLLTRAGVPLNRLCLQIIAIGARFHHIDGLVHNWD